MTTNVHSAFKLLPLLLSNVERMLAHQKKWIAEICQDSCWIPLNHVANQLNLITSSNIGFISLDGDSKRHMFDSPITCLA